MSRKGFTIVELLIVIVVIGILAALVISTFAGAQARARDADRMNDLAILKKAILAYQVDKGDFVEAGCGNGTGSGWLPSDYDGSAGPYKPINTCLIEGGYLKQELRDPSGLASCTGLDCYAYLKASCSTGTFLLAHLETRSQAETDSDSACFSNWDTSYGVNYIVKVN